MKKISAALLLLIYLGVYSGKVALFREGQSTPLKVFPYPISNFSQTDQETLRRGVPITSLPEYAQLIEDYFS